MTRYFLITPHLPQILEGLHSFFTVVLIKSFNQCSVGGTFSLIPALDLGEMDRDELDTNVRPAEYDCQQQCVVERLSGDILGQALNDPAPPRLPVGVWHDYSPSKR